MNNLTQSKWADHLRGCAQITNDITRMLDIRDDAARQATFATVCIDATKHNIFVEPIPESKTPVITPEPAAAELVANAERVETAAAEKDRLAAEKADAQINDVPRVTTPEQDQGVRRSTFLSAIESARNLLNKEGHVPPITPAGLKAVIKRDFAPHEQMGTMDVDDLERLMMALNTKLDELREKNRKAKTETEDDLGF